MQLSWLRSPLHRLIAVATGTAVAAGVSVTVWHQLNASPAGTAIYSGVQAATAKGGGSSNSSNNGNGNPNGNGNNNGNAPHSFTISGSLDSDSVYPGLDTYIDLSVDNTMNNQAIRVTSLTVTVGDASSTCTASNLSPVSHTYSFSVVVAKNSTDSTSFRIPISMIADAAGDCQGAHFPLTLSGTATGPA